MSFENGIHHLKSCIQGSRNLPEQMIRKYLRRVSIAEKKNESVKKFQPVALPEELKTAFPEAIALCELNGANEFHTRCTINGRTYFSAIYSRGMSRSSRYIMYNGNSFGEILFFFVDLCDHSFCILRKFHTEPLHYSVNHFRAKPLSELLCIPSTDVNTHCCRLKINKELFLVPVLLDYEIQ